jgi:hypothetical protein
MIVAGVLFVVRVARVIGELVLCSSNALSLASECGCGSNYMPKIVALSTIDALSCPA